MFDFNVDSIVVGLAVILLLVYWRCKTECEGIPPGPPFLPVLGNLLDMRGEYLHYKHHYFAQLQQQYGSVFRIYFGSQLMIMLNDFESIDEAFVQQKDIFSTRPTEKLWAIRISNDDHPGVIWSNGPLWKTNRRFAIKSLRNLGVGKSEIEKKILEEVEFMMEILPTNEPFKIRSFLLKSATNIIGTVVYGQRWNYNDPELIGLVTILEKGFESEGFFAPIQEFPSLRFVPFIANKMMTLSRANDWIFAQIGDKIKSHGETFKPDKIRDFIDVVLTEMGKNPEVDKDSIKRTVQDFIFAGSDTTASTLDWAFLYMLLHLEILKKCQTEIDDVVGWSRRVEMSDRPNLPYVEATLLEVQRLSSIAAIPAPRIAIKDTMVRGYLIPEGSLVFGNIYNCHRDPKHWPNPSQFDPQRFLNEDGTLKKLPPAFMPFSTGPRSCPGDILTKMELFLYFTSIIQRYDITKGHPDDELSKDGPFGLTRSPHPYNIKLSSRLVIQ